MLGFERAEARKTHRLTPGNGVDDGRHHLFENRGDAWTAISADLTRRHILCLSESPRKQGLIYAASGNGEVQLTRDDGKTWAKASTGLPKKTITRIIASRHAEATAYVCLSGAGRDEFDAHVFRTRDFGKTWKSIGTALPDEPVYAIAEDPVRAGILYVGTMLGVFVTIDAGATWVSLCHGLPPVPVFDLAVHPRDHELVAGTHGRSVFVLDVEKIQAAAQKEGR